MTKILNMGIGLNMTMGIGAMLGIFISYPAYIELTNVLWGIVGQSALNVLVFLCFLGVLSDD